MADDTLAQIEKALAVQEARFTAFTSNWEKIQQRQTDILERISLNLSLLSDDMRRKEKYDNGVIIRWLVLAVILSALGSKGIEILASYLR